MGEYVTSPTRLLAGDHVYYLKPTHLYSIDDIACGSGDGTCGGMGYAYG